MRKSHELAQIKLVPQKSRLLRSGMLKEGLERKKEIKIKFGLLEKQRQIQVGVGM